MSADKQEFAEQLRSSIAVYDKVALAAATVNIVNLAGQLHEEHVRDLREENARLRAALAWADVCISFSKHRMRSGGSAYMNEPEAVDAYLELRKEHFPGSCECGARQPDEHSLHCGEPKDPEEGR